MEKLNYYRILWIFFLGGLLFISGCEKLIDYETGFLEGKISIGPICPVETDPPDPGCLPTAETYKAYPVSVRTLEGNRKVTQLNPALDGSFTAGLLPGSYMVILETGQNKIGSSNLPVIVTINSQNKTILNIDIDTGIR